MVPKCPTFFIFCIITAQKWCLWGKWSQSVPLFQRFLLKKVGHFGVTHCICSIGNPFSKFSNFLHPTTYHIFVIIGAVGHIFGHSGRKSIRSCHHQERQNFHFANENFFCKNLLPKKLFEQKNCDIQNFNNYTSFLDYGLIMNFLCGELRKNTNLSKTK